MTFHIFLNYILILIGFIFNFFLSGFVFVEFTSKIQKIDVLYKFPLYFIFSFLVSTWGIFILSLVLGFNNLSVLIFYAFVLLGLLIVKKNPRPRIHLQALGFSFVVFIVFVISLYPAIFFKYKNYFVMAADNWQDTALHLSIYQSLTEGNFLPKAPYFSGRKLTYYYFSDLHSAIVSKLTNEFHPRIFVVDNSIFAAVFALSLYYLTYFFTKNKATSLAAVFLGIFNGNLLFFNFLNDLISKNLKFIEMLNGGAYVLQYGGMAQMTPITNYFLQNRPMMAGLPVLAAGIYLISDKKYLLAIVAMVLCVMFQPLVSLVLGIYFAINIIFNRSTKIFIAGLLIAIIFVLLGIIFRQNLNLLVSNLKFVPWQENKDFYWYLKFYFINFGILAPFSLMGLIFLKKYRNLIPITIWSVIVFSVPFICVFTLDKYDMLKFFYLLWVPFSVISAVVLSRIARNSLGKILVIIILCFAPLSGLIDLGGSIVNRNFGYSESDLAAGLWIRNNTPQKSVFLTTTSIHSPPTDIAGRLRVLSYTNWPYTHGFNVTDDNVFSRSADVEEAYKTGDIDKIKLKYSVNYIYFGSEEHSSYPLTGSLFDNNKNLSKIYSQDGIDIYRIIR